MTSFDYATIAAVACPLGIVAIVVATVLILASKADDGPLRSDDPTPLEDEEPTGEIPIVVDPPVAEGFTVFRGGLVHVRCLGPKLLNDAAPCAGCAVHLDHVLTGA